MKFYKYEGLGNDFIILQQEIDVNLVPKLCDRNFGIGADGVIIDSVKDGKPFMQIYNQDGSVATMCGNGIRCYASYLDEMGKDFSVIYTLAGDKHIEKVADDTYKVYMGYARLDFIDKKITEEMIASAAYTGVEHLIIFNNDNKYDRNFLIENSYIEEDGKMFPNGTNLNLVKVIDRKNIEIITHERGVGITLACGTGACASAYVSKYKGYVDNDVLVKLLGGYLNILITADDKIYMTGNARKVFVGEIEL